MILTDLSNTIKKIVGDRKFRFINTLSFLIHIAHIVDFLSGIAAVCMSMTLTCIDLIFLHVRKYNMYSNTRKYSIKYFYVNCISKYTAAADLCHSSLHICRDHKDMVTV